MTKSMDNRKYYNTPRDRIDDKLLLQLLGEAEPESRYGIAPDCPRCAARNRPQVPGVNRNPVPRCNEGDPAIPTPGPGPVIQNPEPFPANESGSGNCRKDNRLAGFPLSMVYAPDQEWSGLFEEDEALGKGTLFRDLDLPFCPGCRGSLRNDDGKDCGCRQNNER